MDVKIAGVHRSPWVQGPGESWMELIPAVEFPNFDINIVMNTLEYRLYMNTHSGSILLFPIPQ